MIATTIEQSLRLHELGLDPKTADMTIGIDYQDKERLIADKIRNIQRDLGEIGYYDLYDIDYFHVLQPAWSLSALLEVMPKSLVYNGKKYILRLQYEEGVAPFMYYVVAQGELKGRLIRFNNGRCVPDAYDALDAAYQLITWLLEDGYIKKGGQDETAE